MKARITFRSEALIEGATIEEIQAKWNVLDMGDGNFIEVVSVEDAETYEDISDKIDL